MKKYRRLLRSLNVDLNQLIDVACERLTGGFLGDTFRLKLTWEDAAGQIQQTVMKRMKKVNTCSPFEVWLGKRQVARRELFFYESFSAALSPSVPRLLGGVLGEKSSGVIFLEDLSATRIPTPGVITHGRGLTLSQGRAAIRSLARLHAHTFHYQDKARQPPLPSLEEIERLFELPPSTGSSDWMEATFRDNLSLFLDYCLPPGSNTDGFLGTPIGRGFHLRDAITEWRSHPQRMWNRTEATPEPQCPGLAAVLSHGDLWTGNIYFAASTDDPAKLEAVLLDFQFFTVQHAAFDVLGLLTSMELDCLTIETARLLITEYLDLISQYTPQPCVLADFEADVWAHAGPVWQSLVLSADIFLAKPANPTEEAVASARRPRIQGVAMLLCPHLAKIAPPRPPKKQKSAGV